jgi:hypothetical protein
MDNEWKNANSSKEEFIKIEDGYASNSNFETREFLADGL